MSFNKVSVWDREWEQGRTSAGAVLPDPGVDDGDVSVHFRNLEAHLIHYLSRADYVVGCVAWLTNQAILEELARKKGVCLIVHYEQWLAGVTPGRLSRNDESWRYLYSALPMLPTGDDPVYCIRNDELSPRGHMHHKFVVLSREQGDALEHYGVWAGSFNYTEGATHSLDSAFYTTRARIVEAYRQEFIHLKQLASRLPAMQGRDPLVCHKAPAVLREPEARRDAQVQRDALVLALYEAAGEPFDATSLEQSAEVLRALGQPDLAAQWATGDELERLRGRHRVVDLLLDLRRLERDWANVEPRP